MTRSARKILTVLATIVLALAAGMLIGPVVRNGVSTLTVGIVVGVLGTLCIVGIGYGIWHARSVEKRCKAKEQIWINH